MKQLATSRARGAAALALVPSTPATVDEVASSHLPPVRTLPLSSLRTTSDTRGKADADLDRQLVASIRAIGLVQPLAVTAVGDGTYKVVAGRRRLAALLSIHEEGRDRVEVPVLLLTLATSAEAASLAENAVRRQLDPLEEADAFARLSIAGWDVPSIGAAFAFSDRLVQQRLQLSVAVAEARDLYRRDRASLADLARLASMAPERQRELAAIAGKEDCHVSHQLRQIGRRVPASLARFPLDGVALEHDFFDEKGPFVAADVFERLQAAWLDGQAAAGAKVVRYRDSYVDRPVWADDVRAEVLRAMPLEKRAREAATEEALSFGGDPEDVEDGEVEEYARELADGDEIVPPRVAAPDEPVTKVLYQGVDGSVAEVNIPTARFEEIAARRIDFEERVTSRPVDRSTGIAATPAKPEFSGAFTDMARLVKLAAFGEALLGAGQAVGLRFLASFCEHRHTGNHVTNGLLKLSQSGPGEGALDAAAVFPRLAAVVAGLETEAEAERRIARHYLSVVPVTATGPDELLARAILAALSWLNMGATLSQPDAMAEAYGLTLRWTMPGPLLNKLTVAQLTGLAEHYEVPLAGAEQKKAVLVRRLLREGLDRLADGKAGGVLVEADRPPEPTFTAAAAAEARKVLKEKVGKPGAAAARGRLPAGKRA